MMAQEFQLLSPVFVREENRLAIIPTCGDVKCGVSLDEPGFACHTALVPGIIGQNARSNSLRQRWPVRFLLALRYSA